MTEFSNIDNSKIVFFQNALLSWFEDHGRQFAWRNRSASNYLIIISEVLLQRTKAETVAKFLPQFIKKYPSWRQLGNVSLVDLQEALRPIGLYKQRGARLYKLAQEMKIRNGRFPKEKSSVQELPMMGQYISNAFQLFILKKPAPLLDVNMSRVLERFFGYRELSDIRYDPYLQQLATEEVNTENSKKMNWAILDLGGIICTSRKPKCYRCPLSAKCLESKSENC